MILVGSQRGGSGQLAAHLLNDRENDHVTLHEVKGFAARDLGGALAEAHAVSKGTRCKQFMFSLSINPPRDADAPLDALLETADRAGEALGLRNQPRVVVVHEKKGRRHIHVVWSRIDAAEMKAVNLPFFKERLAGLSRELYLDHGWELPDGHKTNGWKNPLNFTLAEWQQAKRLDLDPREIKQVFQSAWARSDSLGAFRHALEEHGYYLARGDRRGVVAVDLNGEVLSVARWASVRAKDVTARLGDTSPLPSVADRKAELQRLLSARLRDHIRADRQTQRDELKPLEAQRAAMAAAHAVERDRLKARQEARWREESKARADRLHKGILGFWDFLTGKARAIRRENEAEAFAGLRRDRGQAEALYAAQVKERRVLEARMDAIRAQHRTARRTMTEKVALLVRYARRAGPQRQRDRSNELEL